MKSQDKILGFEEYTHSLDLERKAEIAVAKQWWIKYLIKYKPMNWSARELLRYYPIWLDKQE